MDILRYSRENSFQDTGPNSAGDLGVSVEDLAYSMRHDLLFQQQQQQSTSTLHQSSNHSTPVPDNAFINGGNSRPTSSLSAHSHSSVQSHGSPYVESHSSMQSYGSPHVESYNQKPSQEMAYTQQHIGMDFTATPHSPAPHTAVPHRPVRQPNIQNHHVIEQVTFQKSATSFYKELYGNQSDNNNSPGQRSDSFEQDGSFTSPRMLPKPPMEPRRSRTRSSLRRAAKALLNRSRQNLSEPEPKARKPEKQSTPPPSEGKLKRSGSIRDKLKENRNKMAEVLKKPAFLRRYSQGNENTSPDVQLVAYNHDSTEHFHKYGSTGNIHQGLDDVDDTAPVPLPYQHSIQHERRFTSMDNIQQTYSSSENVNTPQSRQVRANSHGDTSNFETPHLRTYNHPPRQFHSSTSDLETSGSESRSYGSREMIGVRSESPGYQLRRHSSGPVYNTKSPRENVRRGYHTADSDTDSSISRHDGYWPQSNRHDARRPLPSTKDTLRMLQKKREGAHHHSPRGMSKMQSGPLRADHNIQAVRKDDSFTSPTELGRDPWLEQGARPKHTQSTESLETEEVTHELLPDSIIRSDSEQDISRQSRNSDISVSSSRSRQRAPSPSRSVHFEDANSSSPQHKRMSHSKAPSKSALRNSSDYKHRPRRSSDSNAYDSEYSTTSEVVEPPYQYRDSNGGQNRNNSGYANQVMDAQMHAGIDANDPRGPGRLSQPSSRCSTPVHQYDEVPVDRSRLSSRASPDKSKSNRKRASSQPPLGKQKPSPTMRHSGSRESLASMGSNPCIVMEVDDRITHVGAEIDNDRGQSFTSDLDNYSDISSSRLSIVSRTSISDKMHSMSHATKKKFNAMRKALSLDRMDKAGIDDSGSSMLKKSPSLRSLTSILGKKKTNKDETDGSYPAKLNKNKSASVIGLYSRPQRSSYNTDVTTPSHGRKVGKLLSRDPDGSQVVELVKPPAGPFGFYIARGTYDFGSGIFVTRLGDGHPAKILAGLLGVGDEILEINGENVRTRPIDDVYDIMMDNDKLVLKIMPLMARKSGR